MDSFICKYFYLSLEKCIKSVWIVLVINDDIILKCNFSFLYYISHFHQLEKRTRLVDKNITLCIFFYSRNELFDHTNCKCFSLLRVDGRSKNWFESISFGKLYNFFLSNLRCKNFRIFYSDKEKCIARRKNIFAICGWFQRKRIIRISKRTSWFINWIRLKFNFKMCIN
jgi:hypothetical protein